MSAVPVKEQLHRYIDLADAKMAEALLAMFKNYFQDRNDADIKSRTENAAALTDLQRLLLEAPDMTDEELELITAKRKALNQWD